MKVASLSQSCAAISSPNKNYHANKKVNTGSSNATRVVAKTYDGADKALRKVYCLSTLSFLGCLAAVYTAATFFATGGKAAANNFSKVI